MPNTQYPTLNPSLDGFGVGGTILLLALIALNIILGQI